MTSSGDSELEKIRGELDGLSLRMQQLNIRRQILDKYEELRKKWVENGKADGGTSNQQELDSIDDKLRQLSERSAAFQKRRDNILNGNQCTRDDGTDSPQAAPACLPDPPPVFIVDPHPSVLAPTVILDLDQLSYHPAKTQCPQCEQFITTDVVHSVSSLTWLMCFTTAMIGCVAGCCLIPFCTNTFKTATHRCPRCRTLLRNVQVL